MDIMANKQLSELDDYKLTNSEQDCRGWCVVNASVTPIGTVREMLVDEERERVTAVVLDSGAQIPVHEISLRDGRADQGRHCHPPCIECLKAVQDTGYLDDRTSWDDGAHHGHRLQQGRVEHHGECDSGVLREEGDHALHRLTSPAAFESPSAPAAAPQ